MWEKLKNKEIFTGIVKNRKKDGTPYYVDATIVPITDIEGEIIEYIGIRHDISEIMNPKKQLMADILHAVNPILVFLKIGNYSLFRDFYSESVMHKFENEFEKNILEYFPKYSQIQKVYNLSNGLFAFLKNEIKKPNEVDVCLHEVLTAFKNKGVNFEGNKFDVDVYMSFSMDKNNIFDDVSLGIEEGIKTKSSIIFAQNYYNRSQIEAKNNLKNIQLIKDAFANEGKFILQFQPIIDNKTKDIAKYEGLIRLVTKSGNIISPFHFLPVSKKTGYYNLITEVVIDKCYEVLTQTDKSITINLGASDIENLNIRNKLLNLIGREENKGRITYELLEDETVSDMKVVKDFISLSKVIGDVKIAIDDFGSGYSNYERLLEFQPDILKIDGSLIKNIEFDEFSKSVVESIIVFAKKQNIQTVAEFVSNENIHKIVTDMGIDFSQGFYLGEPKELV